jgi:putative serine protease PepD
MTETPENLTPAPENTAPQNTAPQSTAAQSTAAPSADGLNTPAPAEYFTPATVEAHEDPVAANLATDKPRRSVSVGFVAAVAVAALVGGVSGAGVSVWALTNNSSGPAATITSPANITVNDTNNVTTITAVAQSASSSVVTISVNSDGASGTGSGVVIDDQGHILTNTHVVTLEGKTDAGTISVRSSSGSLYAATLVGIDPLSDLAVIKVQNPTDLTVAKFADSAKLNVGDTAIAIGAPLGLSGTVTNGIVSALNRSITIASSAVPEATSSQDQAPAPDSGNPFDLWQFDSPGVPTPTASSATISLPVIQTDAAINPGNSGGALLDSDGNVIGINVAIATAGSSAGGSGSIGVGFAIPANLAQRIASEIIATGSATHGLLGASILDVTQDETQTGSKTVGASVKEVPAGGAAAAGGIRVGDIITGFNGLPITGASDLTAQVRALAAGAEASVTIVRDGKLSTVRVTLGSL